jgi:hypothetical protein
MCEKFRESPAESGNLAATAPVQEIVVRKRSGSDSDSESLSSSNCIAQADSLRMAQEDRTDRELSMVSSTTRLSTSEG